MNDHAGWGRDGKCTSCGTDDPRGPCRDVTEVEQLQEVVRALRKMLQEEISHCPGCECGDTTKRDKVVDDLIAASEQLA